MMQKIFSYKYLFLGLLISVLIPFSFAHADSPGDTSIGIPDPYTGGPVTVTVEARDEGGNPVTVTITVTLTPSASCTSSIFSASPNPIISAGSTGVTTITANATCAYDIRVGSTAGSLFAQGGPGSSSSITGNWVNNGMVFYLQKRNDTSVGGTLATLTVNVTAAAPTTPATPTGFWAGASATCGSGQINLSWNASSGATSYTLKRDGTTVYTGSGLSYSDTGLAAGSNHAYTVSASNSAGTSGTASASATAPSACSVSVPTVTFTANPLSMTLPTNSTTLTWSSTNSPTSCTASSNPVNSNWNGAKSASGSQVISGLTAGSKIFYLYCTNSGGNSITQSQTVNVINAGAPNPDLKGTVWTDTNRNVVWGGYNSVNGPVVVYNQASYALSWPAVSNATSCALDGSAVSVSGGTINTYTATLASKTHTLSCTGAGGTTSDTFTLTMPPAPTNLIGTCPTPYTSASLGWTAPAGYNNFYVRLNIGASSYTWPPTIATEVIGTTWTPATTPGQSYTWWISTKNVSNGAWSPDAVSYNLVCNNSTFPLTVTKAGTGTGTVTPSTGTITWSGNTGTANYNSGTSVTLTAAATGGSTFTGWSGGVCSGTGTCVVSMTQARSVTATFNTSACVAAGTGAGLTGKYYNGVALNTLMTTRPNDGAINFNPADSRGVSYAGGGDTFSVSWEGQVQPRCSENYTFYTNSNDGVRLWVNGVQIINNWTDHVLTENSGSIALVGGTKYDIKMEFYENLGGAVAQLSWSSPSTAKAIVPATQLYTVAAISSTASISAGSTNLSYNTATNITWSSTNATSCSVSPASWSGTSGTQSTGNLTATRTYTVSCNPVGSGSSASVTVNVQAQPKSLTVIKSGQGTITSGPVGISCGSDCTEEYAADSTVVLTATPSSGRIFTGWGGDGASCGRNATCSIIMNSPKSVIANFAVDPNYKEF